MLGSTAQECCRQPRAIPAPRSTPTPASAQTSTGVIGVRRLATAIGAARAKPMIPPTSPLRRSSPESHWNLAAAATEAVTPKTPPTIAPTKSPRFPAPFPSTEPITAPSPARIQAARNTRRGFNEWARLTLTVLPNGSRLSCGALKKDSFLNLRAPLKRRSPQGSATWSSS